MRNQEVLNALGKLFFAVVSIDLVNYRVYPIVMPKAVFPYMNAPVLDYRKIIPQYCRISVRKDYRKQVYQFMDPETICRRLKEEGIISMEYIGQTLGWCKIILIPSKYDKDGNVIHMLYTVLNINQEKLKEHKMSYLAEHDSLTGLINRSGYQSLCRKLCRTNTPVCFMMIDIDYFKLLNDTHGHEVGDVVLQRAANLLLKAFRPEDSVIRMGGDEFAVIIPGMRQREGKRILQHRIAEINRKMKTSTAVIPAATISAGAAFSESGFSESLYRKADSALYKAKKYNRGSCYFY
ncbi:MAG: GGDEF domain-containing protein [Eubacterium sp.]